MAKQWSNLPQGSKIVISVGCGAVILICCSTLAVAAADRLFWRPAKSAPEGERAGVTFSARIEVQMHCQDCGAPHYIIHEHGETTVIRIRDEE
jgi:hypothetical protein